MEPALLQSKDGTTKRINAGDEYQSDSLEQDRADNLWARHTVLEDNCDSHTEALTAQHPNWHPASLVHSLKTDKLKGSTKEGEQKERKIHE